MSIPHRRDRYQNFAIITQLYFTTKCDSKKKNKKQNLTKLN